MTPNINNISIRHAIRKQDKRFKIFGIPENLTIIIRVIFMMKIVLLLLLMVTKNLMIFRRIKVLFRVIFLNSVCMRMDMRKV